LLQSGTLPGVLSLDVNGGKYHWKLGKAARYYTGAALRRRGWRAWKDTFSSRHRLYNSLWRLLHPLTENERRKVLEELRVWADAEPVVRSTHRALSLEEVVALTQGDLIEIGAHTVTHPALSALPVVSQRKEIVESKVRLEEMLGQRVDSFAYPNGSLSTETVGIVREAGFACACSSFVDLVGPSADLFQLPRAQVMDWDGEKFARWLSRWFRD
jgi:peptidoglycan/xylan/chitin deacetylase (PgdA/CDA1 family)